MLVAARPGPWAAAGPAALPALRSRRGAAGRLRRCQRSGSALRMAPLSTSPLSLPLPPAPPRGLSRVPSFIIIVIITSIIVVVIS